MCPSGPGSFKVSHLDLLHMARGSCRPIQWVESGLDLIKRLTIELTLIVKTIHACIRPGNDLLCIVGNPYASFGVW